MSYNYQDAPRESQQEYFGKVHTDNKETLYNALKRIAELEKDNRLLEQRGSDILKELLDKNKRCMELEKENEELRNNGFTVSAMTEQHLKVAIEKGEQLEKQLEQAKEIIKHLPKDIEKAEHFLGRDKISREAEEFLKEDA